MSCDSLATKSELNALRSEFSRSPGGRLNPNGARLASDGGVFDEAGNQLTALVAAAVAAAALKLKEALEPSVIASLQKAQEAWNAVQNLSSQVAQQTVQIVRAYDKAVSAETKAEQALKQYYAQQVDIARIERIASEAISKANEAITKANNATTKANEAITEANNATTKANEAMTQANAAMTQANAAMTQANNASRRALDAISVAGTTEDILYGLILTNTRTIQSTNSQVEKLKTDLASTRSIAVDARSKADATRKDISAINQKIVGINNEIFRINGRVDLIGLQNKLNAYEHIRLGLKIDAMSGTWQQYSNILRSQNSNYTQLTQEISQVKNSSNGGSSRQQIDSIKQDFSTFKNDLSTFKNDLSTFKYDDGVFKNDLSTFKNDLSTVKNDTATFKNDLATFKNDTATFKNDTATFKNDLSTFKNDTAIFNSQTDFRIGSLFSMVGDFGLSQTLTNNRVGALESTQTLTNNRVNTLEQTSTNLQTQVQQLDVNSTQKLDRVELALGGIALGVGAIAIQTSPTKLAEAAETGVCSAAKPTGCLGAPLQGINNGINAGIANTAGIGALGVQNAQILANTVSILSLLQTVWAWLQTSYGFFAGKFEKLWNHRLIDRALAIMNLAVNLHNGAMLSSNLAQTLGQVISNILGIFQVTDPEGKTESLENVIGNSIEGFVVRIIGNQTYQNIKLEWAKYSTIYSAVINIWQEIDDAFNSMGEGLEVMSKYQSKVANALLKSGTVLGNAYERFAEKINFKSRRGRTMQRIIDGLGQVNELAEDLENATSNFRSVTENVNNIRTEWAETNVKFAELEAKEKTLKNKEKQNSTPPTITDENLIKPSP